MLNGFFPDFFVGVGVGFEALPSMLNGFCPSCRSLWEAPRGGFEFGVGVLLFLLPAYVA